MVKYLSGEYLDRAKELARDLPETPGASARLQQVVTGGPDGDVRYRTVIEDGRIVEHELGVEHRAEVTLTNTYDDAVKIARGELDASAAFMQGRVKVAGDMGRIMSLMPLTSKPEYRAIGEQLCAETEF